MKLYIVQHGEALAKDVDPDRPLTDGGVADIRKIGHFVRYSNVKVHRIIHSGKTRARQTAEVLAETILTNGNIETESSLGPNDPVAPLVEKVKQWMDDAVIVGHLPFVAKLVAYLVAKDDQHILTAFQPGSMVCLEQNDNGQWIIAWMLRPELV